jgi:hypothetical protein
MGWIWNWYCSILKLLTTSLSSDSTPTSGSSLRSSGHGRPGSQGGGSNSNGSNSVTNAASDQLRQLIRAKVICLICLLSSLSTRWLCDLCQPQTIASVPLPTTPRSMAAAAAASSSSTTGSVTSPVPSVSASGTLRMAPPMSLIAAVDKLIREGSNNAYLMQCCHVC